jgi:starch phosphorylase
MSANRFKIPYLPEDLSGLADVALNFSWRWNRFARELFRELDPVLWHLSGRNPIDLLRRLDPARLQACARDPDFMALYEKVRSAASTERYSSDTWFSGTFPEMVGKKVAYFCAEFGIHKSVPIYSGGLGVLAGDHCKAASDLGVPLVGVGLLYLKGYFGQRLTLDGWQVDNEEQFNPETTPLEPIYTPEGARPLAQVTLYGRTIHVGAWRMMVGRTTIILLDSNLEENEAGDRDLTQKLYQGGHENRLCQEWILGVGGVRVLRALGIHPDAWHANEGHAAFMMVERVREFVDAGLELEEAKARVRAAGIFTTHTPVPAGHDAFSVEQVDHTLGHYWKEMGLDRETFLSFGAHQGEANGTFHMTACGMRLSRYVNGVAQKHGEVTRKNWNHLWPGRAQPQVPIGHVTNGVHLTSWMAWGMMDLLDEELGPDWMGRMQDPEFWKRVLEIDDHRLCEVHKQLKQFFLGFVREQARQRWRDEWKEAVHMVGAGTLLDPKALTIGFARRFATYKRADLIFSDRERLRKLLTDPWKPVQIVFAGKAHPADDAGKEILQRVFSFSRDPEFEGRIAFIEDYDLNSSDRLLQGVDLWLNLPVVPMEASGTSGMKAALNGVPHLSTLDGWWAEGYSGLNGWALPLTGEGPQADAEDALNLYDLLEKEIVPAYYHRDEEGLPREWLRRMKHALFEAGKHFTAARMLREYATDYYAPAFRAELNGDDPPTGS